MDEKKKIEINIKQPEKVKMEIEGRRDEIAATFFSMLRGDKGDTGEKGDSITGPRGERGEKGDTGETGPQGAPGKDGKKGDAGEKGKDGKDFTREELLSMVKPLIPAPIKGKDGTEISGKQIIEKLKGSFSYDDLTDKPNIEQFLARKTASRDYDLIELKDVSIASPTNAQVLKYNSTTGKWENGTSSGGSGITRDIASISSPATLGATASTDYVRFVSGTTTATLPTAVGNTNMYTIKNTGVAVVTIATTGGQTIDGSSSASLPVSNTSLDLVSDGSNWRVV